MTKSIERELNQFRETFRHKNVVQEDNFLVYRTPEGLSDVMAKDANVLIKKLSLPLVAIPTNFYKKDSFHITAK